MQLALGTAQFGFDYGISNQKGRISPLDAADILSEAGTRGIRLLDTAPAYGCSEQVLGDLTSGNHNFDIVGKTPAFAGPEIGIIQIDELKQSLEQTIGHFGGRPLHGMLVHHGTDTLKTGGGVLLQTLTEYRNAGYFQRIGLSVDGVEELDDLLGHFDFDIVQVPLNILNQALITDGYISRLKARGVEVHVRSLFLQGLVFLNFEQLPEILHGAAAPLRRIQKMSQETGIDICTLAIGYVTNQSGIDYGVVGVTSRDELIDIHNAWQRTSGDAAISNLDFSPLAITDPVVTTPVRWLEQK